MFNHFSGGSTRSEPKFNICHCSECGGELYADEELICHACSHEIDDIEDEQNDN